MDETEEVTVKISWYRKNTMWLKELLNDLVIRFWGYKFVAIPYFILFIAFAAALYSIKYFFTDFKSEWLNLLTTFLALLAVMIAVVPILMNIREKTVPKVFMTWTKSYSRDYDLRVCYKIINGRDMFLVVHHIFLVDWSTTPPGLLPLSPHISTSIVLSPYGEYSGDSGFFAKVDATFLSSKMGLLLITNKGRIVPSIIAGKGYPTGNDYSFVSAERHPSTEYKAITTTKPAVLPKTMHSHFIELLDIANNEIVRINVHDIGQVNQIQGIWPYHPHYDKIQSQQDVYDYFTDVGFFTDKKFLVLSIYREGKRVEVDRSLFPKESNFLDDTNITT